MSDLSQWLPSSSSYWPYSVSSSCTSSISPQVFTGPTPRLVPHSKLPECYTMKCLSSLQKRYEYVTLWLLITPLSVLPQTLQYSDCVQVIFHAFHTTAEFTPIGLLLYHHLFKSECTLVNFPLNQFQSNVYYVRRYFKLPLQHSAV